MTSTQIVELTGVVIALIGSIFIPLGLNRRKATQKDMENVAADVGTAARLFKEQAEALQLRLDRVMSDNEQRIINLKAEHHQALIEAEAGWRRAREIDQAQITQLRTEMDGLYRRLYETRAT